MAGRGAELWQVPEEAGACAAACRRRARQLRRWWGGPPSSPRPAEGEEEKGEEGGEGSMVHPGARKTRRETSAGESPLPWLPQVTRRKRGKRDRVGSGRRKKEPGIGERGLRTGGFCGGEGMCH
ncbi:unnamed protein product [Prorocentrum cordatum]|uniref:Uncharacterized protein n=1 Tax=Prorocentrum cordatum TaxID=2364126 RepID=A0ABN9UTL1_9DINO|nr:unnamed protein product [Polarella glacialis]